MTDKKKLEKIKELADAMYYAAQQLTTDASRLHKAMDEYHKFIIHECKDVPVSKDLEAEIKKAFLNNECSVTDAVSLSAFTRIARHFANWQKEKDQSTIELAEDHAMLAGMEKMKEQMMKDVVEVCIVSSFGPVLDMPNSHIRGIHCTYEEKESTPALFVGDKVKMIIIKEE